MKNLMNLAIVLFAVTLLSGSVFAQQGQGLKNDKGNGLQRNWLDADGDGICDNYGTFLQGANRQAKMMNKGVNRGTGVADGTGNGFGNGSGVRPQDGTGFGKKNGLNSTTSSTSTSKRGGGRSRG